MALVAARFGIMAKDAFPLGEVSAVEGLPVADPPPLGRSVVFRSSRPPGHGHGQGPLPFQLRLLDLLAGQKAAQNQKNDCQIIFLSYHREFKVKILDSGARIQVSGFRIKTSKIL
jgi:hypothetical protein